MEQIDYYPRLEELSFAAYSPAFLLFSEELCWAVMEKQRDLLELATNYHKAIPARIRWYLNKRGIPDVLIDFHLLGWNGRRITIPIFSYECKLVFFKLARDPEDRISSPKIMTSLGASVELYGWEEIKRRPNSIIICEGEFDRLVLENQGFITVTSTGGAGSFREEWARFFRNISHIYVCFDRDEAGRRGAERVGQIIPQAKLVELPAEVGEGGDVTDFFVRLGRKRKDFLKLLEEAKAVPPSLPPVMPTYPSPSRSVNAALSQRIERIKQEVPIADVVGRYVKLRTSGNNLVGLCPFHKDTNPSLAVYPKTGTFYCYGCSKHGDVITFIREIQHLSFGQALDVLDSLRSYHGRTSQPGN
jgi:hypothetical protein